MTISLITGSIDVTFKELYVIKTKGGAMSLYNKIIDYQKLSAAWQRVRRNKPAAGVDNITWQQFDENSRGELKQLQIELIEME